MTEIYQGWLENPDTQQILKTYGATQLNADQQVAIERLVKAVSTIEYRTKPLPTNEYWKLLRIVRGGLVPQQTSAQTRNLVSSLGAVCDPDLWHFVTSAADPHVSLRDQSHRRS